jgi:hypothetical protein
MAFILHAATPGTRHAYGKEEASVSANTETCSHCGAENPPGRDTCVKCGQPLTGSADEAVRTQLDRQEHGSLIAPEKGSAPAVDPAMGGRWTRRCPSIPIRHHPSGRGSHPGGHNPLTLP